LENGGIIDQYLLPTVGHLTENLFKKSNAPVPHICPTPHLWGLTLIGAYKHGQQNIAFLVKKVKLPQSQSFFVDQLS
jgi:hypothetical protein